MADGVEGSEGCTIIPPTQMAQIPAWGVGMALGECIAEDLLANDAEMAKVAEEMGEEKFVELQQNLMCEVMSCMGKATNFLEELDEDDDNGAKNLVLQ